MHMLSFTPTSQCVGRKNALHEQKKLEPHTVVQQQGPTTMQPEGRGATDGGNPAEIHAIFKP